MALDLRNRTASYAALEAETFDVLVIGAGISGAGIARDAALRGLRVALVEARDIAAGTSSRSSKLVHGGIRYLSQGDVALVREAATERGILRRLAPHLAQTLPMLVPARSWPSLQKLRTGLWAYEKLGKVAESERHQVWDQARLRREEPELDAEPWVGAVVYPEYLTDDARLTLANVRASAEAGAVVVSYAPVVGLLLEDGHVCGAEVGDALPGGSARARVQARVVVNAAGPWVDAVRELEQPQAPAKLQLTEGIHLVFSRATLPLRHTVIMTAADKRSLFAVPRGSFVYIGTTDTHYPQPDEWPAIAASDIDYLLEAARRYFPQSPLDVSRIVALWSGVRPLLRQDWRSPSEISRRDETMVGPGGLLSVAGGKLTAYRRMAERVVDLCEQRLGREPSQCVTADLPLPGALVESVEAACQALRTAGADQEQAERLVRLYGTEAAAVWRAGGDPASEAVQAVRHEGALQLEDWWLRRSSRAWFAEDGGIDALEPAARAMAELLDWSAQEQERQIAACRDRRTFDMSVLQHRESRREEERP